MEPTSTSGTHAQPSTLVANCSELSRLSGPDTVPCQHSQDGAPDSEPASNLALRSGQSCTSNQEYSGSSPMTWSKDGDAEAAPVDAAWSDLFDNREKLKTRSGHWCSQVAKGTSNISASPQHSTPLFVKQGSWIQLDPPSYTPAMNVQNNGVKMILPYYQSLFTKFFSLCHCALEHWSSVARYLKVPDVPLPPTKPTSLGRSTSLEFVPDSIWAIFGVVEYLHCDHRDTVPDRCPDSPKAAAAAAAKYFAAMKKWDEQNVDVAEYIVHVEVPLVHVQHPVNWFIRPHLGYPGELDRNDHPLCEAASCILPAGKICKTDVVALRDFLGRGLWPAAQAYKVPKFYYKYEFGEVIKIYVNEDNGPMASSSKAVGDNMEDHGFNIYDDIMGNPYDEDDDNWENKGDYDLNPTPHLDAKQEAEAKALVLTAESGDAPRSATWADLNRRDKSLI
ncbi:hypothetical protein BS47DRAFT_1369227 [Hydnum rufescens UP504]|uniref:Uncharacterized protein n=1 Tax=Hydnum rufescens UP504 TaxID=1448309 RepID=A0A9P6AF98_9AGAM|nr:hypothetical protein BS47DRAFT_1369227 [Hydnum rufescens UP504]